MLCSVRGRVKVASANSLGLTDPVLFVFAGRGLPI